MLQLKRERDGSYAHQVQSTRAKLSFYKNKLFTKSVASRETIGLNIAQLYGKEIMD